MPKQSKKPARKSRVKQVWGDGSQWTVGHGRLVPGRGRPRKTLRLFKVLGEKLPIASLDNVAAEVRQRGFGEEGVYVAHDSMGYVRYAGRGRIFQRLKDRAKTNRLEIAYFSFYVVQAKVHEREVETLLIRVAAPMLYFNDRKKRLDLRPGNIADYEPGTEFFERHHKKGRRARIARNKRQ
jgi:hypothetical protein